MGGVEFANPAGTNRFRALIAYLEGPTPFGQFFNTEDIESFGVHLAFDF